MSVIHAPPRHLIDAETVIYRLEEAGATLLAFPARGYSTGMRCGWPEVVRDFSEAYGYTAADMPPPAPDARAITRMDEALAWITLIPSDRYVLRRIVGARALVSPRTGRNLYSWRRLGLVLGCSHEAVRVWHGQGVALIVKVLRKRHNRDA